MKSTSTITDFVLVKADTNSDWDECQFALIHCTAEWREQMKQRLKTVQNIENEIGFVSLNFYDTAIDFYRIDEDDQPDINALLEENDWAFVELEDDEQEAFLAPENRLDTYRLSFYRNGTAMYSAYGKNTGEEFYTQEFSVSEILDYHQESIKIIQLF